MSKWVLKLNKANINELAPAAGISSFLAFLLANRGIDTPAKINSFLQANLQELDDPLLMKDMAKGLNLLKAAISGRAKVVIHGDYDVDGVIGTVILYKGLRALGANVTYYIPDREKEGYGLSTEAVAKYHEEGVGLILTCDNGISSVEQVAFAKAKAMTVVIIDHHEPLFTRGINGDKNYIIPNADAVINPKQPDCLYPFKVLCAAGLAYKFVTAFYNLQQLPWPASCADLLELAAIATICDIVDLLGENRIIVKNGLVKLNKTANLGLKHLIKEASLEGREITAYHVGFILGPCINAAGRIDKAALAVELLLADEERVANDLAKQLYQTNIERKRITEEGFQAVLNLIETAKERKDKVLVISNNKLHESVTGIVAGKVKEKYNLPAIILSGGKELVKGSARSIDKYNIFEELLKCADLLTRFGGHALAAGLSLKAENIETLRERLNANCLLSDEDTNIKIKIDMQLPLEKISFKLVKEIELLAPYGKGNPQPLFAEKKVVVDKIRLVGKDKNVLKLWFRKDRSSHLEGICFKGTEKFINLLGEKYETSIVESIFKNDYYVLTMDIVFTLAVNRYNGKEQLQLIVEDFRNLEIREFINKVPV